MGKTYKTGCVLCAQNCGLEGAEASHGSPGAGVCYARGRGRIKGQTKSQQRGPDSRWDNVEAT